jgi:hypothetical protein
VITIEHAEMRVLGSIRSWAKQSPGGGEGCAAAGEVNFSVVASTMPVQTAALQTAAQILDIYRPKFRAAERHAIRSHEHCKVSDARPGNRHIRQPVVVRAAHAMSRTLRVDCRFSTLARIV